ncbi:MAG: DEAD/DEAH box helicase [Limnochordia bacterium]|jgi:SNF2 family DNA or RNA helicase|nr:DEAD/DEAH box helicase [Bacillota bacterium]
MQVESTIGPDELAVLSDLCQGCYDTPAWFQLRHRAELLALRKGFESLWCLEHLPHLSLYPHQEKAVFAVLREMRGRAILADEVGLGKTIEALVILMEYFLRGLVRRALILTPASLVSQWRGEITSKFKLPVVEARSTQHWHQGPVVLASLDTAKRPQHAEMIGQVLWDLVIVDEAHHLKNKATINYRFVDGLNKKYLLLLTATPLQNDLGELYNLVTLLRPGQLATYSEFRRTFTFDRRSPRNLPELRRLLREVMVRTSRKAAMLPLTNRRIMTQMVPFTPQEREFYDMALLQLRRLYRQSPDCPQNLLFLVLILREICSSPWAAGRTLKLMASRGKVSEDMGQTFLDLASLAARPSRYRKIEALLDFLAQHQDEKVLVFTSFRMTQALIAHALRERGIDYCLFHGAMDQAEKDGAVAMFADCCRVMVSTEAGGEGRNLQFCRLLVNFDLPWNPMRLAQRLGRIDRLGQTRPIVGVNLVAQRSIEEHVLFLLDKKLQMFTKVMGEIDPLLGQWSDESMEYRLGRLFLSLEGDALDREVARMGDELARSCLDAGQVSRLNRLLLDGEEEG